MEINEKRKKLIFYNYRKNINKDKKILIIDGKTNKYINIIYII